MVKVGQIFFWNGGTETIMGKLITHYNLKTFKRSDTTHCGIIAEIRTAPHNSSFSPAVLIYEAGNSGFKPREVPLYWFEQSQVKIGETKEAVKGVLEACKRYENIGYAWFDLVAIMLKYYTGLNLNITGKNSLICSEAVCRVLYDCSKSIDFQKEYKIPFDLITPEHIFLSKQVRIIK
jgi:hypothetical protein